MLKCKLKVCGLMAVLLFLMIPCVSFAKSNSGKELPILMYHNVIKDTMTPNKYEIRLSDLERDFKYIKECGYTTITPKMLVDYTTKNIALPQKPIMITFDDGFYNYNLMLANLLLKYNFSCVVSVVGQFREFNKHTNATSRYIYMEDEDIVSLQKCGKVEMASHSFDLHNLKKRVGVKIKKGENTNSYKQMFNNDCKLLENVFENLNIKLNCYTYPYGAFCTESEQVIRERGYKVSLTCEERINVITSSPDSLFKLGRFNMSGVQSSIKKILKNA